MTKQPYAIAKRCGAKTRSGEPCKSFAMANGRCRMHGGKSTGAPKGNQNAKTHGFFQKHMPPEAFSIMNELFEKNPIDILWENIVIQYTAIIRAQRIMYVRDQDDVTITKIEEKTGNVIGSRWEVQQAWDKQANFLQAQSKAMSILQSMISRYEELCRSDMATEEQRLRIQKLKLEIGQLSGESNEDAHSRITDYVEVMRGEMDSVFNDEDHAES